MQLLASDARILVLRRRGCLGVCCWYKLTLDLHQTVGQLGVESASRWDKRGRGGTRNELVKPFDGIQLVQVQSGQSRSGQAGSECCHSPGDWRVRSVHSE